MADTASILTQGVNSFQSTSEMFNAPQTDFFSPGVVGVITNTSGVAPMTGALAVNAQGSPNMTVAVTAGKCWVTATPTSQGSQLIRASIAAQNVTISSNATGGTRYDWIYVQISASGAAAPAADGTGVATVVQSRSTSATTDNGTPPTYGTLIAIVTVVNSASSIANGAIADKRVRAAHVGGLNDTNGNEVVKVAATASAVNEITVTNAATGGVPLIKASSSTDTNVHIQVSGLGNGLTKVSILRQNDTSNTYNHNSVVLTGWGFKQWSGSVDNQSESVTFGITFAAVPIVLCASIGDKTGSDPSTAGDTAAGASAVFAGASAASTTGFTAGMTGRTSGGNIGGTIRSAYGWAAIGEL